MKKSFLILLAIVFLGSPVVWAGTKTLNFGWQQTLPSPNDMGGWRLYQATTAGASCKATKVGADIPYVSPQTEYTMVTPITVPDGQVTVMYFSLTAYDTSGNESPCSNEVAATIDFQSPSTPVQLKVTITTP